MTQFFILREDIQNPQPDRRSKTFNCRPIFPKGTFIECFEHKAKGTVPAYKSYSVYGGSTFTCEQAEAIEPFLDAAPLTVGQIIGRSNLSSEGVLAMLVEAQVVSLDTIGTAIENLSSQNENEYDSLLRKHWLHR